MKKGFTLIELLAVIVILAIIALIATPIVLNIIKDSKESSNERSLEMYKDSLEMSVASYLMENPGTLTDEYYTKDDGKTLYKKSDNTSVLSIDYSGSKVTCDSIQISERGKVTYSGCKVNGKNVGPQPKPAICKRAETLHTEECTQTDATDFCSGAGYTATGSKGTTTITYGNLGTKGTLTSGDAFDCDVNGDKTYDPITERFYYVSGKDGDPTSEYATLIYYNNVSGGVANNSTSSAYDSSEATWQGPVTAIAQLPTTDQWGNVSLSSTTRVITNELGGTTVGGHSLPPAFSYAGYAARLLTAQEVNDACGITVGLASTGDLDNCNYLMENTEYSSSTLIMEGYWLETPKNTAYVYGVYTNARAIVPDQGAYYTINHGIRPVIEVLKSQIDY